MGSRCHIELFATQVEADVQRASAYGTLKAGKAEAGRDSVAKERGGSGGAASTAAGYKGARTSSGRGRVARAAEHYPGTPPILPHPVLRPHHRYRCRGSTSLRPGGPVCVHLASG
jgi:hypothetical protein